MKVYIVYGMFEGYHAEIDTIHATRPAADARREFLINLTGMRDSDYEVEEWPVHE